jgi:ribosome-binding protein aMBF1 (putative translation factor)
MIRATMTRRELAAALASSATLVRAQEERKLTPEELLAQEKVDVRSESEQLEKFNVPMATEPAFIFRP